MEGGSYLGQNQWRTAEAAPPSGQSAATELSDAELLRQLIYASQRLSLDFDSHRQALGLTMPMSRRSSRQSVSPNLRPKTLRLPAVGIKYPVRAMSREVFPEPLAPRITQCCPASTRQETWSRMTVPSRFTNSPSTSISGGRGGLGVGWRGEDSSTFFTGCEGGRPWGWLGAQARGRP